jgi:hypothetical protein
MALQRHQVSDMWVLARIEIDQSDKITSMQQLM